MRNTVESSTRGLIFGTLAMFVLAVPVLAQKPAAIDPKAQEMLRQSALAYAALHSYSCQVETETKMDSPPRSQIAKIKMAFQKPTHAATALTENGETRRFLTNGKHLYIGTAKSRKYTQYGQPPDVSMQGVVLVQGRTLMGQILLDPSTLVFLSNATETEIEVMTLGPPQTQNGVEVRMITCSAPQRNDEKTTLFVTLGVKDHFLYRFASTLQSPDPLGAEKGSPKRIDTIETYTNIQADPALPASAFLPPAGAKIIKQND